MEQILISLIELRYPPIIIVFLLSLLFYLMYYHQIEEKIAKVIIGIVAFLVIPGFTYYLTGYHKNRKDYINEHKREELSQISCSRIQFSQGSIFKIIEGKFKNLEMCYKLRINAGQTLMVSTNKNFFDIKIVSPDDKIIIPKQITKRKWMVKIPLTGDYKLLVKGYGNYTMQIIIPMKI